MSEIKQVPTFRARLAHFWEYYKWPVLIGAFCVAVLAFFTAQCAGRVQPDYTVVLYLNQKTGFDQRIALEALLARAGQDLNGDGQVEVEIVDVSFSEQEQNLNIVSASRVKALGQMSMSRSMLYITDTVRYPEYRDYGLFQTLDWLPDQDHTAWDWQGTEMQQQTGAFGLPEHLLFSLRRVEGTAIADEDGAGERLTQAEELLRTFMTMTLEDAD